MIQQGRAQALSSQEGLSLALADWTTLNAKHIMDLTKLQLLNTDTLQKMQAEIERVLKDRVDTNPGIGRIARFQDSRTRQDRVVIIERLNQKTVSCVETSASASPGMRWKVGYGMLKVEPIVKKTSASNVAPTRPVAPQTSAVHAW